MPCEHVLILVLFIYAGVFVFVLLLVLVLVLVGLERALQKLLSRYFTPSLLSIHPAINAVLPSPHNDNAGCESCYK